MLISDFYAPYLGGVEQHVRTLAQALAGGGHHVVVVTLAHPDLPAVDTDGAVLVRRVRSTTQRIPWLFSSTERPWAPPIADPGVTLQLRRLIKAERPDVVHGHDWLSRSFLPLRRWSARRFGTRFVSSLHYYTQSCARKNLMRATAHGEQRCGGPTVGGCLVCTTRHYGLAVGPITAAANALGAVAERRGADTVIAVSAATAVGNGLGPTVPGVAVIPNFLPDPHPSAPEADAELLAQLPDEPFLLFVGDLRPMKGLDVLLRAYAATDAAMPLVLIGKSWPDTPGAMPAGVRLHDRWPNSAVLAAWKRCAIGVVPSVWAEPFGIVVIEAMAAGAAVVASAIGGIPEIIEDGVSGLLVPPGDHAALAAALRELMADRTRRQTLGLAARERAARYAARLVVPEVVDVYRAAIASPRRRTTSSYTSTSASTVSSHTGTSSRDGDWSSRTVRAINHPSDPESA
jgi:glycosyltransferase involved in cell wall biosynthesis